MLKIKVPGTTANIGPGFDAIGIALELFNYYTIEKKEDGVQEVAWDSNIPAITDDENYSYLALIRTLKKFGKENLGFKLTMGDCEVPVSRGIGSSASAIVGGIYAANYIMGDTLTVKDIADIATEIEGHPDNAVPAVLGGMIVSVVDRDGTVINSRVKFPDTIDFVVMIPNFKLSTEEARLALPDDYSIKESVFNLSRTALLVNALNNGELENLRAAIDDKLHQPFRAPLIEGAEDIFAKSKELGALGEFISGAGPTLISLIKKGDKKFIDDMRSYLDTLEIDWDLRVMNICMDGTSTKVVK